MSMSKDWPILKNPPVMVALFQIKFEMGTLELKDFLGLDAAIRVHLPNRNDTIEASINVPSTNIPLGISKISGTSNARVASYVYFSADQKIKLAISNGSITLTDERPYESWQIFESEVTLFAGIFSDILKGSVITRTSIRFINQFFFKEFEDPTVYFRTLISATDRALLYPLVKYGFKLTLDIEDNIYSIVNQNLEKSSDKYIYIFDIDVLSRYNSIYNVDWIVSTIQHLRNVKNTIFFNNVTNKTIELCN